MWDLTTHHDGSLAAMSQVEVSTTNVSDRRRDRPARMNVSDARIFSAQRDHRPTGMPRRGRYR